MKKNLSISEFAKLCNVSTATISRVMNHKGGYSKETEIRILDAIEKYNFTPNLVAKGLRTKKTPIIGVIVPDIVNTFYSKMVLELQMALFQAGYLTMVCNVNESEELEKQEVLALLAQNISGLILISGRTRKTDITGVPVIYIDRVPSEEEKEEFIVIESDNLSGGYMVTQELINNGCKRIAFMTDKIGESTKTKRYEGYCKAILEAGLFLDPSMTLRVNSVVISEGERVVKKAIDEGIRVDGIVCATDNLAIGAILGAKERGLRVPEDIKVTGFDDVEIASLFTPALTTVHQYNDEMAKAAAEKMIALLSENTIEERHILIPVILVPRESSRSE